MNIKAKYRRGALCLLFTIAILLSNAIGSLCSCNKSNIMNNMSFVKEMDVFYPQTSTETEFVGDVITKNVYRLKITAEYKETLYYPIKDITERKYTVTNVERDGVCEKVTEQNYISIDDNGNICSLSLEHIMDTEIRAYEKNSTSNSTSNGMGTFQFNKTEDEIRTIAEELLGDIVDWSLFNRFDCDLRSPTVAPWETTVTIANYTYAFLNWEDYQTSREFACLLQFADFNSESGVRTFYDKAYISAFFNVDPFDNKKNLSKYIERIPKYEAFNEYYTDWIKQESGLEPYNFSSQQYRKGIITTFNGKKCYYFWTQIYDPNIDGSKESIYVIIPLE